MNCLNDEQLHALCNGTVEELVAEELFEHIRSCPTCEELLNEIEAGAINDFRRQILKAARCEPFCDEPQLTVALTMIRDTHVAPRTIDGFPFDLTRDLSLTREVSSGGVGTVFDAVELPSHQRCAVKMLNVGHRNGPARQRFEREVRVLQSLDHPNIVCIRRVGEWEGVPYLVTEYIDGENLATIVHHNGPFKTNDALRYARQVAQGLRYAHHKSIVHRDLTPANLLLDADDVVKIVDLGLAKVLRNDVARITDALYEDLTPRGVGAGTRPFMSPEQLEGLSNADERSDIYSLGATLCFLLSGSARGAGQLLGRPSSDANGDGRKDFDATQIPESVRIVLRKMLEKQASDRYQTMDAVVAALSDVFES